MAYPRGAQGARAPPSGLRNSVYTLYETRHFPTRKVRVDKSARPRAIGRGSFPYLVTSAHSQLTPLCLLLGGLSLNSYFSSQFISLYVVLEAFKLITKCQWNSEYFYIHKTLMIIELLPFLRHILSANFCTLSSMTISFCKYGFLD